MKGEELAKKREEAERKVLLVIFLFYFKLFCFFKGEEGRN